MTCCWSGFIWSTWGISRCALKYGIKPTNMSESIEFLSTKIGLVMLILGAMHFFNLIALTGIKRRKNRGAGLGNERPLPTIMYGL